MAPPIRPHPSGLFDPRPFAASPLYEALCPVVATDTALLDLALHAPLGQRPEFAFFGAVHYLLLEGADHELARFYPSLVGDAALAPTQAGPALTAFCADFRDELVRIIGSRLVQTNHVTRAFGLRMALAAIATHTRGPVDVIEVGASAGLLLRFDRYGYRVDGLGVPARHFGDPTAPVQLTTQLRGTGPLPDLDMLPAIGSVVGVDLNPIDASDADSRAWLTALVWPENHRQRQLLSAALASIAPDPPRILAGDAIDLLPRLAATLPADRPRVVFHCATRIHVPQHKLAAFDAAIGSLASSGPLWRIAIEYPPNPDPRPARADHGVAVQIDAPDGSSTTLAVVDGHLRWIEPLDPKLTRIMR